MRCSKVLVAICALALANAAMNDALAEGAERRDQVVITSTLSEKRIADAPGSVEVITAREIEELNALTVADVLENAVGVQILSESGRSRVPSIRGARSKHTLVLLDGRRLAYGFNDLIDLRQIPTVMVERIEIVRGPASSLYGSDALGGVVNIITRQPATKAAAQIGGRYGVHRDGEGREYAGSAQVTAPLGDAVRFILAGELRDKKGWDRSGQLPDDGFAEEPAFVAGRIVYDLSPRQSVTAGGEFMNNTYLGDQLYEGVPRERRADEERAGYFVQYDLKLRDFHDLTVRLNRSQFEHDLQFNPYAETGERRTRQYVHQSEVRYSGLFFNRHLATLGVEWRQDGLNDWILGVRSRERVTNTSLFVQDEFQVFEPLSLVLALRYDHHGEFGDRWTPQAALVYHLLPSLRLKASWGQGFRAPSLTELYVDSMRRRGREIYQANKDLKPEKANSYEVGIEGEWRKGYGGVVVFRNEIDDLIEALVERTEGNRTFYRFENISRSVQQGVEVQAGYRLPLGFSLNGNFSWLDIDYKGAEDIGSQPKYSAFVKLGYELPEYRLRANLRMNYQGRKTYADGNRESWTLYGAYLAKGIGRYGEIFIGVDNIFDKRIVRDSVSRLEPTTYYGGVTLKF